MQLVLGTAAYGDWWTTARQGCYESRNAVELKRTPFPSRCLSSPLPPSLSLFVAVVLFRVGAIFVVLFHIVTSYE